MRCDQAPALPSFSGAAMALRTPARYTASGMVKKGLPTRALALLLVRSVSTLVPSSPMGNEAHADDHELASVPKLLQRPPHSQLGLSESSSAVIDTWSERGVISFAGSLPQVARLRCVRTLVTHF